MAMEFRILGPLEVVSDGRAVALGGTRRRAVLAALLLHANEVVSSDALIDEVWGEDPPDSVVNALQVHVSGLRKTLAEPGDGVLVTRPPGYVLKVGAGELDLDRFEQLRAEARAALDEALQAPRRSCARRSRFGAVRRSTTCASHRRCRSPARGSRSCARPVSRIGSLQTSPPETTAASSQNWRSSLPRTLCARDCGRN